MDKLLKLLNSFLPNVDFSKEKHLVDDKLLTSLNIISLIVAIDKEFDVTVSPLQLTPENFNSVESIYSLIENLEEE